MEDIIYFPLPYNIGSTLQLTHAYTHRQNKMTQQHASLKPKQKSDRMRRREDETPTQDHTAG